MEGSVGRIERAKKLVRVVEKKEKTGIEMPNALKYLKKAHAMIRVEQKSGSNSPHR